MAKFKTYIDDDGEEIEFTVFIIHGHSDDWRKIESFINKELKFKTIVLRESFSGKIIFDKFRDTAWENMDCAVAVLTPDDELNNGTFRARQNVFFELGYCRAVFDSNDDGYNESEFEQLLLIKHKSIDLSEASDLLGIECLEYDTNIDTVLLQLRKALKGIYKEGDQ
jgi:predicted nucleotide-binding protein